MLHHVFVAVDFSALSTIELGLEAHRELNNRYFLGFITPDYDVWALVTYFLASFTLMYMCTLLEGSVVITIT